MNPLVNSFHLRRLIGVRFFINTCPYPVYSPSSGTIRIQPLKFFYFLSFLSLKLGFGAQVGLRNLIDNRSTLSGVGIQAFFQLTKKVGRM